MLGAIIGTGISVAANALGSWIANKRKREAEEKYKAEIGQIKDEIDSEINGNYLDRADARNAIRQTIDANKETMRQLNTAAIRGGATDEAKVAMASKLNKNTADIVGNLAAVGELHKDRLKDARRSLLLGQAEHNYQIGSDTSGVDTMLKNIGTAAQNLGTAWSKNTSTTATPSAEVMQMKELMNEPVDLMGSLQLPYGRTKQ